MKHNYQLILFVFITVLSGCSGLIDPETKPLDLERNAEFTLQFVDSSGFMKKLTGKNFVSNAVVLIKSSTFGTEYQAVSDSNGIVTIKGAVSDNYIVSAVREMSADEMIKINGDQINIYKLMNKKTGIISLSADKQDPISVEMDQVSSGMGLILSEVYASGPVGSGLYFHDKYIEIYNQTDEIRYLDGLVVAAVYYSGSLGLNYVNDPKYVHSRNIWKFPGSGREYPIKPGEYIVCAEDAIDHRISAPKSIDLSKANFDFYKSDSPDLDNPEVPNMIRIYQEAGVDWIIGGEKGALVLAKIDADELIQYDDQYLIPYTNVIDGMEYMTDPTKLDKKILNQSIDAGGSGPALFYTGKSHERIFENSGGRKKLKDNNNSSLDFRILDQPTPGYHH